ncbi:MAG: hypothetical protein OXK16_00745 [bacterium]|nr:hypothetical protein [bacterium]
MSDERIPIDQLLDLVEGRLPEDEAARLDATLDEADRRELAVQAAVKTVLGELPGPELSDDERRRLRAAVRAELRVEEASPEPSRGRQGRRSWLARVIPSAAAAATVVAVVAVAINLVSSTDSFQEASLTEAAPSATGEDAPATTAAAAPLPAAEAPADAPDPVAMVEEAAVERVIEAETDAAEADEAAEPEVAAEAEPMMEEAMAEAPAAEMDAEAAAEADEAALVAVEAAAEAAAEASEAAPLGPGYVAFEVATDRPEEARAMLDMVEELIAVSEAAPVPVAELADRAGEEDLVCWQGAADLAGAGGVILWMAPGLVDGVTGEAYLVVPGPEDRPGAGVLALFVYPDCRAVALRAVSGR